MLLCTNAGKYEEAFWHLGQAAEHSDCLVYDEPAGWMQPPAHALGALHLEQGHVALAEKFFRQDMDTRNYGRCHPDNIWALSGLRACLKKMLLLVGESEVPVVVRENENEKEEDEEQVGKKKAQSSCSEETEAAGEAGAKEGKCSCQGKEKKQKDSGGSSTMPESTQSKLAAELVVIEAKLQALNERADFPVQVACMCATKGLKA
jgi:hypothetical protein